MAKQLTVERGLAIASHLSLLSSDKLPSTAPYGSTATTLAVIQNNLKAGDESLWYGVLPTTIDTWIRKLETVAEEYQRLDLKQQFTGVDKTICKGKWEYEQYTAMGRYLLKVGETLLNAKDKKVRSQEHERFEKAKQIERKRSIEAASMTAGKKSSQATTTSSLYTFKVCDVICWNFNS